MSSLIDCLLLLFILIAYFSSSLYGVFGSSRVDSGTEPIEESYDFDTTQEDPSLDPSVGFYPGEPLYLCYLYFWCFASFYYSSHITMLCRNESYMHVPAASYYLIPTSYKPLYVYMLALRVLVHAQVVSSLFYNLIWICYFSYNSTWYSLLLLVWEITKQR